MTNRVFVTGIGLITAIGDNVQENLDALAAQKSGLKKITHIDTANRDRFPVCEIVHDNNALKHQAGIASSKEISRTALLGLIAAQEALQNARIQKADLSDCGLISANSVGGMDRSELFYPSFLKDPSAGKMRQVRGHECGYSSEFIAQNLGIKGLTSTISTACSSSANAIMFAARLIKHGKAERVIAGGCDALTRFTINGFASLKILDSEGCRPFDENRAGLNLGEGAGFVVLESESAVRTKNKAAICEISGYANTCDAYHQTASSPEGEGAFQAMQLSLKMAKIDPEDIDYINAHGTGTKNNDLSEGIAIERLFKNSPPPVSSTKPYTGHTLGAAGGIEAVFSALSIRDGMIYPNLRWQNAMSDLSFIPYQEFIKGRPVRHVVSNSFGFGGNDSCLIMSRVR